MHCAQCGKVVYGEESIKIVEAQRDAYDADQKMKARMAAEKRAAEIRAAEIAEARKKIKVKVLIPSKRVTQTEITKDLISARIKEGRPTGKP